MCLPRCLDTMARAVRRRDFLKRTGTSLAAVGTGQLTAAERAQTPKVRSLVHHNKVADLTHTLTPDFPTFTGQPQFALKPVASLAEHGWNINTWTVNEHTGTHLDAPLHKSNNFSAERIRVEDLIGPLAVVDIRRKAAADPDAELTLDDLKHWEAAHGSVPAGGIVAMNSGWDAHVHNPKFRNADSQGTLHFPGFHIETIEFLLGERDVKGIVVDTLSLDRGVSSQFPVHLQWLGCNRWGLECAANLATLPPVGATLVVGGPKIAGATGGPSRVFALM